jgi:hypothetical protein
MKRFRCLSLYFPFLLSMVALTACVSMPPISNNTNLQEVDFGEVSKFRKGESCTTFLLGLIPFGTSRITAATRDGKIRRVKVVEYETRNYIVISQFCLIAWGV